HAIYSVISPEGAASILWRDPTRARDAATSMKITAEDLSELGIIDGIIAEPVGGAHRDHASSIARAGDTIAAALEELSGLSGDELRADRRNKFLKIGRQIG
ncbi:MAG: acetyl-CoA carboxylase carboxyl transferase subunit alpha, partial [Hoeflea sp.]|nr:acetyl-CoA carboxylase carboxyl transferase subunit alpha [Hoeflea sp.]